MKQKKLRILAPIPCRWIFKFVDEREKKAIEDTFAELLDLSGMISADVYSLKQDCNLNFFLHKDISSIPEIEGNWTRGFLSPSIPVWFLETSVDFCIDSLTEQEARDVFKEHELTEEDIFSLLVTSASSSMINRLKDIALSANLARPCGLYYDAPLVFLDNEFVDRSSSGLASSFSEALRAAEEYQWPPIKSLTISQCWDWLQGIPGFEERRSQSRLGRAVAALTYLLKDRFSDDNELALVWAMLGLEALYGRSNSGLKSQILEKSASFLGPRTGHKKIFSWMYDYRSRFLHGDLDIIYSHNDFDATKEYEMFTEELGRCESVATAILISTLQKMCLEGRYTLDFGYKLL